MSWVLAIDFGAVKTTAAHAADGAAPQVLTVDGMASVPSAVAVGPDGHLVAGRVARNQAYLHPERAELTPKRALAAGDGVILGNTVFGPAELAAAPLRKVYDEALRQHGAVPPDAVALTHPQRWDSPARERLCAAAELAGISGPVLFSEPGATAWEYALPVDGQVVAVVDLGDGTLDVTVLRATRTGFNCLGQPGGDGELGGADFDSRLLTWVLDRARERDVEAWAELTSGGTKRAARDRARLRDQVTLARETLSASPFHEVVVDGFDEGFLVTREGFEALTGDLADRVAQATDATLRAAGVDPVSLAGLYLAGGAASTPLIGRRLRSAIGVRPRLHATPWAVAALGAVRVLHASRASARVPAPAEPVVAQAAAPRAAVRAVEPVLTEVAPGSRRASDTLTSFNAGKARALAAWSPDDSHLAVSLGQGLEVWAMPGGDKVTSITWRIWSAISALAWSPDGTQLVTGQVDSPDLKIWSLSGAKRQIPLRGPASVRSLAWHPRGDRIAVVDDQGNVQVVDQGTGAVRAWLTAGANGRADAPLAWDAQPAGASGLLIVAGEDGAVLRWATDRRHAGGFYPQADEVLALDAPPRAFAWSQDGSRLAACGGGSVRIWDRTQEAAPERTARKKAGGSEITAIRWVPGDRYLLTALTDNSKPADKIVGIALWDARTLHRVRGWTELSGEFEPCRGIALSNAGTRIACLRRNKVPAIHKLSRI